MAINLLKGPGGKSLQAKLSSRLISLVPELFLRICFVTRECQHPLVSRILSYFRVVAQKTQWYTVEQQS